jgi:hypothetical protein
VLVHVFRDNQKVCSATISDTPISGSSFERALVKPEAAAGDGLKDQV